MANFLCSFGYIAYFLFEEYSNKWGIENRFMYSQFEVRF